MRSALALRQDMDANLPLQREAVQYPRSHQAKPFHVVHSVPSLLPTQHGPESDDMEWPTVARKDALDRDEVRKRLHTALVAKIPQYRNPAKEVAARAQTSTATVRSLRQDNIPDAMVTLIMLGREYPEFGAVVTQMIGIELDPHVEAVILQLRQVMARGGQ